MTPLTSKEYIAIIPARYASTRFPGKPLAMLGGKPVVQWVYERVAQVIPMAFVATDDQRILETVESFGGNAIMTSADLPSGTDRVEEAMEKLGLEARVVVNIQGDEPFIKATQIETVCRLFDDADTQIATLGKPVTTIEEIENPNTPKIVTDIKGNALYFSRSVIPYVRGASRSQWPLHFPYLKHVGIYAYRRDILREITRLPRTPLEKAERLEQLRWLQYGYSIRVGITNEETVGIDTPEDLKKAEAKLRQS